MTLGSASSPSAASGRNQGVKIRWAPRAFDLQLSALRIIDLRDFFAKRKEVTDKNLSCHPEVCPDFSPISTSGQFFDFESIK
jgi:hypothetical protein